MRIIINKNKKVPEVLNDNLLPCVASYSCNDNKKIVEGLLFQDSEDDCFVIFITEGGLFHIEKDEDTDCSKENDFVAEFRGVKLKYVKPINSIEVK